MTIKELNADKPKPQTEEEWKKRWDDNHESDEWYKMQDADVANVNDYRQKFPTSDKLITQGTKMIAEWEKSNTDRLKKLAALVVALRMSYQSSQGKFPDWDGRTGEYRNAVKKMYRDANIPRDHADGLQSSLRYHIQNLVVKVAPAKELRTLGYATTSRQQRQRTNQQNNNPPAAEPTEDDEVYEQLKLVDKPLFWSLSLTTLTERLYNTVKEAPLEGEEANKLAEELMKIKKFVEDTLLLVVAHTEEENAQMELDETREDVQRSA